MTSPGPIRMLRPALPKVKVGGFTKHATSNQSWMLCLSAGRLPLQMRLGRVKVPVLAVGVARNTENGAPDCAVTMLVICHPPATASASGPAAMHELASVAKRKLSYRAKSETMAVVEAGEAVVCSHIARILDIDARVASRGVAAIAFVQTLAPGIGSEEGQSAAVAFFRR